MTILEFPALAYYGQRHAPLHAVQDGDHLTARAEAAPGGLLQFQLRRLITEILADPDLDPGMHFSLLRHLADNPGHPDQALLDHLRDVQDPADLPPCNARRKPVVPRNEP